MTREDAVVVGVDFGTLSGRALVVRVADGTELGTATHEYTHAVLDDALPSGTPLTGWGWATVCVIGWVVVGAVGLVHLSIGVARTTPRRFPDGRGPV